MTEATNVKAFREEPDMPPDRQVRAWILLYYTVAETDAAVAKYWADTSKNVFKMFKGRGGILRVTDDIRRVSTQVTVGATTDTEKIQRIYAFCRTKIKNLTDDASGLTDEERLKVRDNSSESETLKLMRGTASDVNALFGTMCAAEGLDVRPALVSDRGDFFFDPAFPGVYFLNNYDVAVKTGGEWRLYDPSSKFVPAGMLTWRHENTQVFIPDPKEAIWVLAPLTSADASTEKRTGTFALSEDGTLQGDVRIEATGHRGIERKESGDQDTPEQRLQTATEVVRNRFSTAEVSKQEIENATDLDKPVVLKYHVRIPGYAQRIGKRLFIQPSFFQVNVAPRFQSAGRHHPVYFHYPWTEVDTVTITMPPGYALDSAEQPESFSFGSVGRYDVKILASKDGSVVQYQRRFVFGADGSIYFPVALYDKLKLIFDTVHERDGHTLTVKQTADN